jgi:hypothetical protein
MVYYGFMNVLCRYAKNPGHTHLWCGAPDAIAPLKALTRELGGTIKRAEPLLVATITSEALRREAGAELDVG